MARTIRIQKAKTMKAKYSKEIADEQTAFEDLKQMIRAHNDRASLAVAADVSEMTLYNWTTGATRKPHFLTMCKVAHALGYVAVWKHAAKPTLRLVK